MTHSAAYTFIKYLLAGTITCFLLYGHTAIASPTNTTSKPWIESNLTKEERLFLKEHPVLRLGVGIKFPPFQYVTKENEKPEFKGMVSGYLSILESRLGIKLKPVYNITFKTALTMGKNKQIDLFPCISKTPERDKFLLFTKPYMTYPLVIITREDTPLVGSVPDLSGKTIAIVKTLATYSKLRNEYPQLDLKFNFQKDLQSVLETVSLGKADACIANLAVASYIINKRGLHDLQVASPTPWGDNKLSMAVRDDWPIMLSIITKALDSITQAEKNRISEHWIKLKYGPIIESSKVWEIAFKVGGVTLLIFGTILYWNRKLRIEVTERMKAEKRLSESEERYKQLSQASFEAILLSENGKLLSINQTAEKMLGYSAEEAAGNLTTIFFTRTHVTMS